MKIYVISDLHIGGTSHDTNSTHHGSQICGSYSQLTSFINQVASKGTATSPVELVVNGDIVDFLMDDKFSFESNKAPWEPNEELVIQQLEKIVVNSREGGESGPFDAMANLLNQGNYLTIILGNHDLELSLPRVRKYFEDYVLKVAGKGRFKFIYDGEAYTLGDVLIEHGNRYDPWNVVDHSALRQERSMCSRGLQEKLHGRTTGQFVPPAGSMMVSNVINPIKKRYRFTDLLKPEGLTLSLLVLLYPKLQHVMSAVSSWSKQQLVRYNSPAEPASNGRLSNSSSSKSPYQEMMENFLGKDEAAHFVPSGNQLSTGNDWANIFRLKSNVSKLIDYTAKNVREDYLLKLFDRYRETASNNTFSEDLVYENAVRELAENAKFRCVIFGHTHLPKDIRYKVGEEDVQYLNTGCWADILYVPQDIFSQRGCDKDKVLNFVEALKNNEVDRYLSRSYHYAEITVENERFISGRLGVFGEV